MNKLNANRTLASAGGCLGLLLAGNASGQTQLLVGDQNGNKVVRFEYSADPAQPSGRPIDHFIGNGISPLSDARGMAIGPDKMLYVVSSDSDEIMRYNPITGQFIDVFVTASDPGALNSPVDLLWFTEGNQDRLLVTGSTNDAVLMYDLGGHFVRNFVSRGTGAALLDGPYGMAIHPGTGNLYVCSYNNDKVLMYNGVTGAYIDTVFGPGDLGLDGPRDIVFDHRLGNELAFYVSSYLSHSVLRHRTINGQAVKDTYISSGAGGLSNPIGLAIDERNALLIVAAGGSGAVYRAPSQGVISLLLGPNAGGLAGDPDTVFFLPEPCRADFNMDAFINSQDFFDFITAFFAGC